MDARTVPITPEELAREMEGDHGALADMLERIATLCVGGEAGQRCDLCRGDQVTACQCSLDDHAAKMLALLLEHFRREEELMRRLPCTPQLRRHGEIHRSAHVGFSGAYNRLIASPRRSDVLTGIRTLESFVQDWVRNHALEFDAELIRLARQ